MQVSLASRTYLLTLLHTPISSLQVIQLQKPMQPDIGANYGFPNAIE